MLTQYETQTQQLLQNPGAPTSLYSTTAIDGWINTARGQLAGDGQCIRSLVTFSFVANQNNYAFSSATIANTAIQGILHLRMVGLSSLPYPMNAWPWEYFQQYFLTSGAAPNVPSDWAQYAQGANGSIYVSPTPNNTYNVIADAVCYPIPLVDNTTPEAIPYPWTDAVPYFAAYLALMSAQTSARIQQAQVMLQLYNEFKQRARRYSTPDVLPAQYEQTGLHSAPMPQTPPQPAASGGAG